MQKYYDIENLSAAKDEEEICALYPDPNENISGYKTDDRMKKAEQDKYEGKCRLLVWKSDEDSINYQLSRCDVEQIITRYKNAKTVAYNYKLNTAKKSEYIFELGRAFALEGILRMLGFDYTEVATCKDIEWEV